MPGARGALLFYSCVPVSEFSPAWPEGVPVPVHGMDAPGHPRRYRLPGVGEQVGKLRQAGGERSEPAAAGREAIECGLGQCLDVNPKRV